VKEESREQQELRLEIATSELDAGRKTEAELRQRISALEMENQRLAGEAAARKNLEASVRRLNEQFGALQQSYACDIDKLVGLLLEVQSALPRKRRPGPLGRFWAAVSGAFVRPRRRLAQEPGDGMARVPVNR
jgi:hypothetical protein